MSAMSDIYSNMTEEKITVSDSRGFQHEVTLRYYPHLGSVFILYGEKIIGSIDKERIFAPDNNWLFNTDDDWLFPSGDDDREWEIYEELLEDWKNSAITDALPFCVQYFDSKYKPVIHCSIESYFRRCN